MINLAEQFFGKKKKPKKGLGSAFMPPEKQYNMPIDEQEWMKAKEPTIGQVPEVTVEAKREPTPAERLFGKLRDVGKFHEKVLDVTKETITPAIGVAGKVVSPTAPAAPKAVAEMMFETAKRPAKDIQIPAYAEERGRAMQDFVKNFGTPKGQEAAQRYLQIEDEMVKGGYLPEKRAIEIPIELYFMGNLFQSAYNAQWAKNFKFKWKGHEWKQKDIKQLWNKINTPGSKFSDEERAAIEQLKKQGVRAWKADKVFLQAKPYGKAAVTPTPTDKALGFRPRPTITPEAKYGITPAGKLAPGVTPTAKPTTPVPTFLKGEPKTLTQLGRVGTTPVKPLKVGEITYPPAPPTPVPREVVGREARVPYHEITKPVTKTPKELQQIEPRYIMGGMPKEFARPPEEMGGLPESLKPKGISQKIHSLYGRIEARGVSTKGLMQEKTILKMVEKGQEQTARQAFTEGKKQGTIQQKEEFETYVAKIRQKEALRGRFNKARGVIQKAFGQAKTLRPLARAYVKGIQDKLDLTKPRTKTIHELTEVARFMKEHPEHDVPQYVIDKITRMSKTPIQDLTIDEVEDIAGNVQAYIRQSQLINNIIIKGRLHAAKEISTESVENIYTKPPQVRYDPKDISSEDFEKRVGVIKELAGVKSWNAEMISEILDYKGKKPIVHNIMYKGIDEGTDKMFAYQNNAEEIIQTGIKDAGIRDLDTWSRAIGGKKAKTVEVLITKGRKIKMTKGERVAFILHSMNEKNLAHITKGGFAFEHNKTRIFRGIGREDIGAIIKSATPEELKMVSVIRGAIDNMGTELNKTSMSLYGREIFTEPNYWRIRTNSLDRYVDALKTRSFGHKTLEGMGFLKERRNAKNAIVLEDAFSTLYKHVKQTSAFHGLAEPLRNAKMLLHDKNFKMAVMRNRGGHYWRALKRYLDDIEGTSISTSDVEKIATKLINKVDLAVLGLNPFVMLKQPVSYLMATTEMDVKYLLRAAVTRPDFAEIAKWSPQLRDRLKGKVTRELGELGQVGAVRQFFTGRSPLTHRVMDGIRFFDLQTIGRVWNATKFEVAERFPNLKGNEYMAKVKERAEEVIRKTQPTFNIKDRSEIGRDRSVFIRLLTKYTSQRNKNYIQLRRAWNKYETGRGTVKDKAKLIKRIATVVIANAIAIEGINEMRNLAYKRKTSPLTFALNTIGTAMGNMYFVGDVFKSIASKYERGMFGYDLNNPLSSAVQDVINAIAETSRGIDQIVTEERYKSSKKKDELKWKTTMLRALDKALTGVGMFTGVPYRTLRSMIRGGYRWLKPRQDEEQTEAERLFGKKR